MELFLKYRDKMELLALKKAFDDAQNTLYPDKNSFTYHALGHGGWKDAELPFHKIGNCPHGLPIFAPWHREYLR